MFVILGSKDSAMYNEIKYYGDVAYSLPTICVQYTAFKNLDLYKKNDIMKYSNVALKLNLKFGGGNQKLVMSGFEQRHHGLRILRSDEKFDQKTMVVGYDLTHPTGQSSIFCPSVAAMVANVDPDFHQWPAVIGIQGRAKNEMLENPLGANMLKECIKRWRGGKEGLPDNILIYRDGVSEGQYKLVVEHELSQFDDMLKELYKPNKPPKMTVIIVGKRHHARFFRRNEETHEIENPKCGTVVDRVITEARKWDFYLQSHELTPKQGTARPAHYHVVRNEIFHGEEGDLHPTDDLVTVTYGMCYLFGRAAMAVSIPTPVYYADLACTRARSYLLHQGLAGDYVPRGYTPYKKPEPKKSPSKSPTSTTKKAMSKLTLDPKGKSASKEEQDAADKKAEEEYNRPWIAEAREKQRKAVEVRDVDNRPWMFYI